MDCLIELDFDKYSEEIVIKGDELKHVKALRLKLGDSVLITNGDGLVAETKLKVIEKQSNIFEVESIYENYNEPKFRKILIVGILHNKDRYEFLLEKAIELGITDFIPLISQNVQKNKINLERLRQKGLSAVKQCKRARIPMVYNPIQISEISEYLDGINNIILLDMNENNILNSNNRENKLKGSTAFIVGPEGGFTYDEHEQLYKLNNVRKWYLGSRRLRTETASIMALSIGEYLKEEGF